MSREELRKNVALTIALSLNYDIKNISSKDDNNLGVSVFLLDKPEKSKMLYISTTDKTMSISIE